MKCILLAVALLLVSAIYSQNDREGFTIKARLVKAESLQISCGVLAVAVTQQFRITETDLPFLKPGMSILLNMPCPESTGKNFFSAGDLYEIRASFKDKDYSTYLLFNNYINYGLPSYWIADIRKLSD